MAGPVYKDKGVYWGKVIQHHLTKSKNGHPQFVLQFTIIGEVDPANPGGALLYCPVADRTVYMVLMNNEASIEINRSQLEILGYEGDRPSRLEMDATDGFNFVGNELAFYCKHDVWEGKTSERWSISTGKKPLEIAPLDAKDLRALDNLFGRSLKITKTKQPTKPQQTAANAANLKEELGQQIENDINSQLQVDGDEIPF